MPKTVQLLTTKEAAFQLRKSVRQTERLAEAGAFAALKQKGEWLIDPQSLNQYLQTRQRSLPLRTSKKRIL